MSVVVEILRACDVKTCTGCGVVKTLEEFPRNRGRRDGRESRCKPCVAAHVRRYRAANPAKVRETQARTNARPERRAAQARHKASPEYLAAQALRIGALQAAVRRLDRDGSNAYKRTHKVVTRAYAPARDHKCMDCGGQAREWAYVGSYSDPNYAERVDGAAYGSPEFYVSLCVRCHRDRDRNKPDPNGVNATINAVLRRLAAHV